MAISLSCKKCRNFIKEVEPKDFSKLTGEEICMVCQEVAKSAWKDVEDTKKKAIKDIMVLADKYLVELDELGRRGVKGE